MVTRIFVQEAKPAQQQIPTSISSFFMLYQLVFGLKFSSLKMINVKFQVAAQRFSTAMGYLMIGVLSYGIVYAPANEETAHYYWRIISLIQYISAFIILWTTKSYTVCDFLSDLILAPAPGKTGPVLWLYTSLVFVMKMVGAIISCVRGFTTSNITSTIIMQQVVLHAPMVAVEVISAVNALIFYHIYIQMRYLKMKLLRCEITLERLGANYKMVADCFDKLRERYDAVFMWGFLTNFPKLLLLIWNNLYHWHMYDSWFMKLYSNLFALHNPMQFCMTAAIAEMITVQTDGMKMILHERLLAEKEEAAAGRALRYVEARPLLRKACRLLPLDLRLPIAVFSLCVTYVIIIIQFTHLYD